MSRIMRFLRRWSFWDAIALAEHGIMSRVLALWTVVWFSLMAGYVVVRVFGHAPPEISAGTAAAFSTFLGAGLAGAWGFFKWASGGRDESAGQSGQG